MTPTSTLCSPCPLVLNACLCLKMRMSHSLSLTDDPSCLHSRLLRTRLPTWSGCQQLPLTAPDVPWQSEKHILILRFHILDPPGQDYWVSGLLKCPLWPREKGHTITCEYPQLLWASVLPVQLQSLWAFVLTWWKRKCREDFIRANEMLHQTLLAITLIISITEWNERKQIFLALSSRIWNGSRLNWNRLYVNWRNWGIASNVMLLLWPQNA